MVRFHTIVTHLPALQRSPNQASGIVMAKEETSNAGKNRRDHKLLPLMYENRLVLSPQERLSH